MGQMSLVQPDLGIWSGPHCSLFWPRTSHLHRKRPSEPQFVLFLLAVWITVQYLPVLCAICIRRSVDVLWAFSWCAAWGLSYNFALSKQMKYCSNLPRTVTWRSCRTWSPVLTHTTANIYFKGSSVYSIV